MPSSPRKKNKSGKKTRKYGASWKSNIVELELPSGEYARVKRPGIQGLIKAKVLDSLDSLTAIVSGETIPNAQGKPKVDAQAIIQDPEKYDEMIEMVNKIVCHVVVEPKVVPGTLQEEWVLDPDWPEFPKDTTPKEDIGRELTDEEMEEVAEAHDVVFIPWIAEFDRMYIMNFVVGGAADLASFRAQSTAAVVGVSGGESAAVPSE